MPQLSPEGKRLLKYIVNRLDNLDVSEPKTYPTYKEAHDALGLQQIGKDMGKSLQIQGLNDLARFVIEKQLPAVTGFIVRKNERDPGIGFFTLYGKDELADRGWWLDETAKAAKVDWSHYI